MEALSLASFHLVEAIAEDWAVHQWEVRVKVDGVDLKVIVKGLAEDVEVVGVRQEGVRDYGDYLGQLVALDEAGVESVQDEYEIVLGAVREVRPVEAKSVVVLFDYCVNMGILWIAIETFCNVACVNIDMLSE